ncbi:related to tetracycline resistance proteins [Phialocephala subalpina]|uniref:Related to tetracycline resistance proteins n=1 Tax=Phialocephala subalpina TaxID=576137 RepID=A0A1L7WBW6_9HELO|nr:related to tetracycline resistance proteins [Phialocephala subalpina]
MSTTLKDQVELRARNVQEGATILEDPSLTTIVVDSEAASTPLPIFKLLSSGLSFLVAGINDGSLGALLPYMLSTYNISTSMISLIYFTTFLGWLVCAITNTHLAKLFPLGALLAGGALIQIIPHVLRAWTPPFALFVITFFISGLGQAYQDSHANTFVSTVKGAHRWLGFIHACYGLGLLISPFVATAVAVKTQHEEGRWMLFYLFPLGMSVLNLVLVVIAFQDSVHLKNISGEQRQANEEEGRSRAAITEVKQMLKIRDLWVFCLFFFFYLGVGTTSGGWIVEFLVRVRHGDLSKMGYVPSGSYGGIFLGRLLLAEPTHRFGERRMLLLYAGICFALQLVFWFVPNLISSIAMFSIMGFFLGPFFAAGVSVASKTFPKHLQPAALGMIFVVAQAGGAIFPSLIGVIATHAGVKVLPPIVAALIIVMAVTWAFVPKVDSHKE